VAQVHAVVKALEFVRKDVLVVVHSVSNNVTVLERICFSSRSVWRNQDMMYAFAKKVKAHANGALVMMGRRRKKKKVLPPRPRWHKRTMSMAAQRVASA
jgi:hypothetical protein